MEWIGIALLGIFVIGTFGFFITSSKYKLDSSLVGLFTLGIFLLVIAVIQPESLKLEGLELVKKVQNLEKNLRPYVIVDINLPTGKVDLIHQTIKNGDFVWLGIGKDKSENSDGYSFKVRTSAKFVELRCENAYGAIISKKPLDESFVKYHIKFTIINSDVARCIIEAFVER